MINITIDTSDADAKLDALKSAEIQKRIADRVDREALEIELSKYHSVRRQAQPFKSAKSRKYFFAALRRGQITVPYQRGGALGSPGNWSKTYSNDGLTRTSSKSYSDLVRTQGK